MQGWYLQRQFLLTGNGNYSITRRYLALAGPHDSLDTAELVWNSVALPKHRFLMWLAVQNRILTKERLMKMNIQVEDNCCVLCQVQVLETSRHVFVDCAYATSVTNEISQWSGIYLPPADLHT